jgi:hypothetical protein
MTATAGAMLYSHAAMANDRKVTYTDCVSVPITGTQREQLRAYALRHDTAMSIFLREEALKDIGREDLSLAEETAYPVSGMLDRKDRPDALPERRHGARVKVNLTREQKRALERAALARGITPSALLRDAGLRAARIARAKPLALGRPLGH